MPNNNPDTRIHILEAGTRNEYSRQIIAGFRSEMPTLANIWDYLEDALNDVLVSHVLLTRLADELNRARLDRANLLAAIRATLAAHADNEADPLLYVRDELDAIHTALGDAHSASGRQP